MLTREVYPTEKFKKQSKFYVFVKINADHQPAVFQKFGVSGMPTMVMTKADGTETHRFSGFRPVDPFVAEMDKGRGEGK